MPTDEKKGITVKIDAGLHAEVRQFLESHEMTMAEFVTQALQDELHPQISAKEDKYMGNIRTIAFQVPEELFQKIKGYLQRNNMTQKEFMLGLIENEIERDLAQRASMSEETDNIEVATEDYDEQEETAVSDDSAEDYEETEEECEEQDNSDFEGDSDGESEDVDEDEELDEDESESEEEGISMTV